MASREQAEGIDQVTIGLDQVETVTQQNTSNAEETASAALDLSGQAEQLQSLLMRFKLSENEIDHVPAYKCIETSVF